MHSLHPITFDRYGDPFVLYRDTLEVENFPTSELLVRVHASGINELDWKIRNGNLKIQDGFGFPKRLGCEFSGVVEVVGDDLSGEFQTGQSVFGWLPFDRLGAHSDYLLVPGTLALQKPTGISHAMAAALPMTGTTALRCLLDEVDELPGKNVLINGGSGGVGIFAIQIAKLYGAYLTATASSSHQNLLRELRVDRAVDYQKTDLRQENVRYDVILDCSSQLPWSDAEPLLTEDGTYLDLQPSLGTMAGSFIHNIFSNKKHDVVGVEVTKADLRRLCDLVEQRGLRIFVGQQFSLDDFQSAYERLESGNLKFAGKAVFTQTA